MISAFLLTVNLGAQTPKDLALLNRAFQPDARQRLTERYEDSRKNPNELQAVLSGLFLFYKSFLSSQDQNRCNFSPSCSEFGLEAVKEFGVVRGAVCTLDRLTRCNGFSRKQYDVDLKKQVLLDPVQW